MYNESPCIVHKAASKDKGTIYILILILNKLVTN